MGTDEPPTPRGLVGNTKNAQLRRWALEALRRKASADELPTSIRHLFYEAVMQSVAPKYAVGARRPDQDLTEAVTWLRERGYVDWNCIEDRTRFVDDHRGTGATISEALNNALDLVRTDIWGDIHVLIVCEAQSIAGVLTNVAYEYRIAVVPTRGQSNGFLRTDVPRLFNDRPVVVGYIGDADKAGADIEANSRRVLSEVLEIKHWERLALTWGQVEALRLPTVQRTDKRNGVTYTVCEAEAYPQRRLLADVRDFLAGWLPEGVDLDAVHEREEEQRREIRHLLGLEPPE